MKLYFFFHFLAFISKIYIQGKKLTEIQCDYVDLAGSGQSGRIWTLLRFEKIVGKCMNFLKNCMILSAKISANLRLRSVDFECSSLSF